MKKTLIALTGVLLFIVMWLPCSVKADAAVGSLYVYEGETPIWEFTSQELQDRWISEGAKNYNYGGYNTYANYEEKTASGPKVEGLLNQAGIDLAQLDDNDVIKFIAYDNVSRCFTKTQLMAERFYYPNAAEGTQKGSKGNESSYQGKTKVPMIIDISHEYTLSFGQIAPNEQSWSAQLKYMAGATKEGKIGKIVILRNAAQTFSANITSSVNTEQFVLPGQSIVFTGGSHFEKIYYTTDGTEPTIFSDIYNYMSYPGAEENNVITAPNGEGKTITIKCFKTGYASRDGYHDSPVQTFTYTVNTAAVQRILNDRKVVKGQTYTVGSQKYKVTGKSAGSNGTVTFTKAKKAKTATVPATVKLADGKTYQVTAIGAKAFAGTKATKIILKTKKLKKSSVKGSLKGSKVKTVKVKVGTKKQNATYVKKYKKIFTKKNAGRKVKVTR